MKVKSYLNLVTKADILYQHNFKGEAFLAIFWVF